MSPETPRELTPTERDDRIVEVLVSMLLADLAQHPLEDGNEDAGEAA